MKRFISFRRDKVKRVTIPVVSVVFGLLLYSIASRVGADLIYFGLDLGSLLSNLGSFLVVLVPLQYYFDATSKVDLCVAVGNEILENHRIRDSGLVDVVLDSSAVDYLSAIKSSERLTVASNYSTDWFKRHLIPLKERARLGRKTVFLFLDPSSQLVQRLPNNKTEALLRKKIQELHAEIVKDMGLAADKFFIKTFDVSLKNSAVICDDFVWVRAYRSTEARRKIPVFKIASKTPMHDFFFEDFDQLESESKAVNFG